MAATSGLWRSLAWLASAARAFWQAATRSRNPSPARDSARYNAFISYSHAADGRLAPALQSGLHRLARPIFRLRALNIFRDHTNLSLTPQLWPTILRALDSSRYFILLASTTAAESKWVRKELTHWFTQPDAVERFLIVLTEGEVVWNANGRGVDWTRTTALPRLLEEHLLDEPLYVDMRWARTSEQLSLSHPGFKDAVATIGATLHGTTKDALAGEDVRRLRRTKALAAAAIVVLAASAGIAIWQAGIARAERDEATRQRDIALSRELAMRSQVALDSDPASAVNLAARAARLAGTGEAVQALRSAVAEDREVGRLQPHEGWVVGARFTDGGRVVVTWTNDSSVYVWDRGSRRLIVKVPSQPNVRQAAISPDGSKLVALGSDGVPRVLSLRTGEKLSELQGHGEHASAGLFSPDGRMIATSAQSAVMLWDALTGARLAIAKRSTGYRDDLAFSRDGQFLASSTAEGRMTIWRVLPRELRHVFTRGHRDASGAHALGSLTFNETSSLVAAGGWDGVARIWRTSDGELVASLPHTRRLTSVTFSADGSTLATSRDDGVATVWQTGSWTKAYEIKAHAGIMYRAAFSADGRWLITAGDDRLAKIWSSQSGALAGQLRGHTGLVIDGSFAPDGAVVTASADGTARVWHPDWADVTAIPGHQAGIVDVAATPDGSLLLTAGKDRTARLWDLKTLTTKAVLGGHAQLVRTAQFRADGGLAVTASYDATARIWDTQSGRLVRALSGHDAGKGALWSAEFSADGRHIVTASMDKTARVWDAGTGQSVAVLGGHGAGVSSAVFSPDGRFVLTGSYDGSGRVFDARSGKLLSHVVVSPSAGGIVMDARFSPVEPIAALVGGDNAWVWEPFAGKAPARLPGAGTQLRKTAFTPDGRYLVVSGYDSVARVFETATRQLMAELVGHTKGLNDAVFSADGMLVLTAGVDGTARVWDWRTGRTLQHLFGHPAPLWTGTFAADDTQVVTVSDDASFRVHRCRSCGSMTRLLSLLHRPR